MSVIIPGIHAALVYEDKAEEIDPRLKWMAIEGEIGEDEMRRINSEQPHAREMRATAQRLRDGEPIAISGGRVMDLLPPEAVPTWLRDDPRIGVIVGIDDTIRPAPPG